MSACTSRSRKKPPSRPERTSCSSKPHFDQFIRIYNEERPHQAIGMQYPCELYEPSPRPYRGLSELALPVPRHDRHRDAVRSPASSAAQGQIRTQVFAGQNVCVREVADHIWLISFMHYDLPFFDDQCNRVERAPNPFTAKVLPMSPE